MNRKDEVYEQLIKILDNPEYCEGITTTELEKFLNVKRSVISHYLNILFREGKVSKTNTRPVKYYLSGQISKSIGGIETADEVFDKFIGADGSLKMQIEQCKSAVVYPPDGLPIIISGNSGVGKSYLASLIYQYARSMNVIQSNAPFVELNCADYANNPELLSSVLFGYVEGAFTGAVKSKKGLMDEADGGYLFLDEIHRLSFENQEKLFLYLDKGRFRRLGENEVWHSVKVRFIFATTENLQETLLETFLRRIPVRITLPDFQQRPLLERLALIYTFYKNEAIKLKRDIEIDNEVLNTLAFSVTKGNIGMLKNHIKLSCANAYKKQLDGYRLIITMMDLDDSFNKYQSNDIPKYTTVPFYISKNDEINMELIRHRLNAEDINIKNLIDSIREVYERDFKKILEILKLFVKKVSRKMAIIYNVDFNNIEREKSIDPLAKLLYYRFKDEIRNICNKYGLAFSEEAKSDLYSMLMYAVYKVYGNFKKEDINNVLLKIKNFNPKAFIISKKLIQSFGEYSQGIDDILYIFFPVILYDLIKTDMKVQAIIATHGDSTASSIASVANSLCGTYIFEPFDMPITDDSQDLVEKVNEYIKEIDTSQGLILLVDMGSLQDMYEPIKNSIKGELLIINNVTTHLAIDIGFRILMGDTLQEIIEKYKDGIHTEVRYYEGIAKGDNIIISCISGIGIAQKLKEIFQGCLDDKKIEIITLEYNKLKNIVHSKKLDQLKNTKLIITTNNLDTSPIPSINIENLQSGRGYKILADELNGVLSEYEIKLVTDELIKFFSIEGIANHLSFLNPNIIIDEVKNIIMQYEEYYNVSFTNYLRLNLYMHISIMIERLMINDISDFQNKVQLTDQQSEFVEVTKNIFHRIIEKYRIKLPISEILLLYEIMAIEIYNK
ncbi:sigma 54-interacting transcriptional regulator [Thermoanaerobacterium thermosaccharolyticum]|uniref:sigma 54-interacting transcriptional regulator n=1 Tax=Thermoanaerobacterium thermosaccharolyticum TaxID=1517 RepID=UPI00123A3D50|nr:sigma 54-interacting transcriptional regulator [Thermoanaerobacterium thermosaccharolyticum]KAA5806023.1 PRD domain-containing protein [Thermoanaerobacterium thermosaccharolyticum]